MVNRVGLREGPWWHSYLTPMWRSVRPNIGWIWCGCLGLLLFPWSLVAVSKKIWPYLYVFMQLYAGFPWTTTMHGQLLPKDTFYTWLTLTMDMSTYLLINKSIRDWTKLLEILSLSYEHYVSTCFNICIRTLYWYVM